MAEELKLTERARDVIFNAQFCSSPYGPSPVKLEHILLALLGVDPDLFQVLSSTETDEVITALRHDLKAFDPSDRKSWQGEIPPLSSDARLVVRLAEDESKSFGHAQIGTEHLLLGLIKSQSSEQTGESAPSPVSEILRARGFTAESVTAQVQTGSLTPQAGLGNRTEMIRALPGSSFRRPSKPFGFMSRAFHRLRGLFVILLMLGWADPAQFMEFSQTNQIAPIEQSKRAEPVTYLALGDSTGLGLGAKSGYGYVEQLMTRIQHEHPGSRLVKLCRLGETTTGLRQRVAQGFHVKPTFVTLSIGINDLLQRISDEEFAANYEDIVKSLKRLALPIVVTNLPDISSAPSLPNSMREEIRGNLLLFNKRIEALAKRHGLLLVDLYEPSSKLVTTHAFFSSDGFHPSDAGYEFWTRIMWPTVKIAINRSSRRVAQQAGAAG